MSDVAIQFVLDNLGQIAVYNANLIINVKGEVEGLMRDLAVVKGFIEDSTEKISEHCAVKELVKNIRALTFEAEDAIDAFVVANDHKSKKWTQKVFGDFDHKIKLRQVAKQVETIRAEVEKIYANPIFGYKAREGGDPSGRRRMERKIPDVEKDNVVGFDTAATTLIDLLTGETEDLQVISIVGMGGLGKTTLANKVYNDPRVVHEFSTQSWIYLSQTYRKKELFLSILKGITQVTSEMSNMGDDELADEVRRNLPWKYLIVVDDVWEKDDWDSIRKAFPDIKNGSRILLTSRNEPVAVHARLHSPSCKLEPYKLDFLTDQQSWELLQIKVFGGEVPEENHDLMDVGIKIASECEGLPLAVVVIAGMLKTKKRKDWWETVASSVDAFLVRDEQNCMKVLALSYDHLPPYLKACFLYFGVFPEDYEIPVWILIRLWIAEGFVQKVGDACIEEMAEDHLEDLAARNLVLVVQRSFSGRIKICRIHDMLRDLCLKKASEESFLAKIKDNGLHLHKFPPNLKRLTLADTFLDWKHMYVLGMLLELEELKLKDNAFTGVRWTVLDGGFRKLKALQIWKTDLAYWEAKVDHFPKLQHIVLKECRKLWALPSSLGTSKTLRTIMLQQTSGHAAKSARKIKQQLDNGLKLDIFPSDL